MINSAGHKQQRRVAHRQLADESLGTAKAGQVAEVVDLGNQQLVNAQYDDGSQLAVDRREVHFPRLLTTPATPVLSRWQHFSAAIALRLPFLALILALLLALVLGLSWAIGGAQLPLATLALTLISAYALWMAKILTRQQILHSEPKKNRERC